MPVPKSLKGRVSETSLGRADPKVRVAGEFLQTDVRHALLDLTAVWLQSWKAFVALDHRMCYRACRVQGLIPTAVGTSQCLQSTTSLASKSEVTSV